MSDGTVKKVSCDPGWNDPPVFSYDSHQNRAKKPLLNKRISYPADRRGSSDQECTLAASEKLLSACSHKEGVILGPPPLSKDTKTGPPPTSEVPKEAPTEDLGIRQFSVREASLPYVLESLESVINDCYKETNEKDVRDIKRRIAAMEKMWTEEKFPGDVKQKLYNISKTLKENDLQSCDNLQRSLMVDYTSLCSSWMSAIRSLINSKRKLEEEKMENLTKESKD